MASGLVVAVKISPYDEAPGGARRSSSGSGWGRPFLHLASYGRLLVLGSDQLEMLVTFQVGRQLIVFRAQRLPSDWV